LEQAISWWFVKKRGLAVGLSRVSLAAGAGIIVPFTTFILLQYGWRLAFVIAGFVTLIVCVPVAWFGVKSRRPEYYGLLPDGNAYKESKGVKSSIQAGVKYANEVGEVEFTLRQALKTRTYWILFVCRTLRSLAWPITSIHLIPFLTDMGVDPIAAASIMGLALFASTPGRFLGGIIMDRIATKNMSKFLVLAFGLQALSLWILLNASSLIQVIFFVILSGFGQGLQISTTSLMRSRYFGRKAWGTIAGTDMIMRLPITVAAPIYVGWVYDTTGSYTTAFLQAAIMVTLATIFMSFLRPPKPPQKITEITSII